MNTSTPGKSRLYQYVLIGIVLGIAYGALHPKTTGFVPGGEDLSIVSELFVGLIKMMIGPIVFVTVVTGIAHTRSLLHEKGTAGTAIRPGRIAMIALIYFEAMTTIALVFGLLVVNVLKPGAGLHAQASQLDASVLPQAGHAMSFREHLAHLVPSSLVSAFVGGDTLQVLLVAVLVGIALHSLGDKADRMVSALESLSHVLFAMMNFIMRAAPIGAFAAMAFTVAKFGGALLGSLLKLMLCFYGASLLFVGLGLGAVCLYVGVPLFHLIRYLRDELLIVLGTSSSESALPQLMEKLESIGVSASIVRLVVPTGYSFNLDGTSIYLTMAAVFVAQALDIDLSLSAQLGLLAILLLTSKGAAAVTGGGFITLASTLSATHTVPVAGLSLLLGVDRFMSEARALTNILGNAVAALFVARFEGVLDVQRARSVMSPTSAQK